MKIKWADCLLPAAAELSRFSFSLAYPRPQQLGAVRLRRPYSHRSWTPSFLLAQKSAQQIKWLDYNENLTAIKRGWNIAFESRRDERTFIFSCCNSLGNLLGRRQLSTFCTRSFLEMALSPFLSAWTEKLVSKPSLHSSICLLGLLSKLCWHFMITSSGTWNSEARWIQ